MTLFAKFAAHVNNALDSLVASETLPGGLDRANVTVEPPRDPSHGDLATNAAMVLAKPAGTNPRMLAEALAEQLEKIEGVAGVEIAGPGFLNLRLEPAVWLDELRSIAQAGDDFGKSEMGAGESVNVEYVSANPTGPMHMGHCRGAVVGDALATLLEFVGYRVVREYYINDAGGQVDTLARSAHMRYREALGEDIGEIPEGLYPGDYLIPIGEQLAGEYGPTMANAPESEWLVPFRKKAVAAMMEIIKADLALLGIHHDLFSSEAELHDAGKGMRRKRNCALAGWSTMASWKNPRARKSRIGSQSRCRFSVRRNSATIRTGPSRNPTAAGHISVPTLLIISRRARALMR